MDGAFDRFQDAAEDSDWLGGVGLRAGLGGAGYGDGFDCGAAVGGGVGAWRGTQ